MNGALDYKIWEPYKSLLPIPEEEISNNSALTRHCPKFCVNGNRIQL